MDHGNVRSRKYATRMGTGWQEMNWHCLGQLDLYLRYSYVGAERSSPSGSRSPNFDTACDSDQLLRSCNSQRAAIGFEERAPLVISSEAHVAVLWRGLGSSRGEDMAISRSVYYLSSDLDLVDLNLGLLPSLQASLCPVDVTASKVDLSGSATTQRLSMPVT